MSSPTSPAPATRRRDEEPEFASYYGRQVIKTPTWKTPDVPLYLFLGGLGGASAVLAEGAAWQDLPRLESVGRTVAAGSAAVGTVFLVHDLGRPKRFLMMLRVLKPTSPLSVGSFVLAPFSALSGAAVLSRSTGRVPRLGRLAGSGSAALGPVLATYTAALFSTTVVPAWSETRRELPFLFAGSGMAAAGGLALVLVPTEQAGPARRMALLGAGLDAAASTMVERGHGIVSEPYHQGRSGRLMRAARAATAGGAALVALGRSRPTRALGGAMLVGGSVLTRFGVFEAGLASARDPRYTVVPQRERLRQRGRVRST